MPEDVESKEFLSWQLYGGESGKKWSEQLVDEMNVSDEELAELYQQCDVLVQPSITDSGGDFEGLGMVLLEAMSYQRPVVATKVGGILDIVRHNETGVLVEERDSQALAQAIEAVLTDDSWARELGQAGFAYAKEYFSWPRIVDQVMTLYSPEAEATCPEPVEGASP